MLGDSYVKAKMFCEILIVAQVQQIHECTNCFESNNTRKVMDGHVVNQTNQDIMSQILSEKQCFAHIIALQNYYFLSLQDGLVKKHKLARELSDLVNYCVSTRFEDFQISAQKRKNFACC